MAEPEVAAKAPESDAQEAPSSPALPVHNESSDPEPPAPSQPLMCDDCTTDRPTPSGQASTGELAKLNDVDVYISKPADYPHTRARLLLLLTGGTGLHSVNNQIQADRFASAGYVVVMPDLFGGDPAPNSTTTAESQSTTTTGSSFLDTFRIKAAETAKSFLIDMWLARHTEAKVLPLLHRVLDACRDEFADAVAHGGGVYAVGYCFGARYVLLLAGEQSTTSEGQTSGGQEAGGGGSEADVEANKPATVGPHIKAGALAHATLVSKSDFAGLRAPLSVVCVEDDPLFPDEVRIAGEEYMSAHGVEHEVQVYPGVPHGFAVVGEYADANIKSAQATAFEQMLKWINEH